MKWYYPIASAPFYLLLALPLRVLYLLSDVAFFILFYITGYRKKVVYTNLKNAFPDKSAGEINTIARNYYRHMVDVVVETLKLATLSREELLKRVVFHNYKVVEQFKARNQSFVFVLGHMGNWEWTGPSFSQNYPVKLYALYHPLSNPFFDYFLYKLRTRFGGGLIPMNNLLREMVKLKNECCAIAFIADQTPSSENVYWTNFLNQDTPVFFGTEKIARRFNYPVVYASATKPARGIYEYTFRVITNDPNNTEEGYITKEHTRLLEEDIKALPHIWLWSHRRWKHKRKAKDE